MKNYLLKFGKISRKLPIVSLGPNIKVASFNLLGDTEIVKEISKKLAKEINSFEFDYFVGPEVKVVPLLYELSKLFKKKHYIVCRKEIHAYMQSPIKTLQKPGLVIDGADARLIKGKKVILIDDVVTSGRTLYVTEELMKLAKANVVAKIAVFKQGNRLHEKQKDLIYLATLPVFTY
ncbi:hypothetical protein A2Z22_03310 [Candidatus Woesebacteria bacterium RBG_16_34_12]|uniref:Phosphoribosyltransferase domain-containing protein n=1 Tax=Candidatus Woesebacteria bacterium RBG_16_34_12 TaxID=1802480 RepID=A0A1F7XAP9_9BACT|nr:MAG: hypothetical protein A2Z22_03310 [Candidatus Woesebacteria bacterium RBG_16_34_12]